MHHKSDFNFFASFQIGIGWFEKVDDSYLPLKTSKRNFQMLNIPFLVFLRSNWEDKYLFIAMAKTNHVLAFLLSFQIFKSKLVCWKKLMNHHQKLETETSKC